LFIQLAFAYIQRAEPPISIDFMSDFCIPDRLKDQKERSDAVIFMHSLSVLSDMGREMQWRFQGEDV
jgi:hypothetical protein